MNSYLAQKFVAFCIKNKIHVNIAESCTGGLISSKIVSINNASSVLKYAIVTYTNESKRSFLKVPLKVLQKYGAVSEETACYMVKGLSSKDKKVNFSLAVTGIAGPSGGSQAKPVGLVYFAFLYNKKITINKKLFKGNRNDIREKAANYALKKSIQFFTS